MVGAGFSGAEADQLRRAMAAWRKNGDLLKFHGKIVQGMLRNGYTLEFAEQCFEQIKGFGEYGFPESHSASFALLVYASSWIKRYHPAAFCAAILNSQPMGFYQPAQLVRDAREHGVEVRPIDVNFSQWDCTLEERREGTEARRHEGEGGKATWGLDGPAVRLGFRLIRGMREVFAEKIVRAQQQEGRFESISHFHRSTALPTHVIRRLAESDAFTSLGLSRRQALWEALELKDIESPLFDPLRASVPSCLRASLSPMPLPQEVRIDYETTSLSLKQHPVALVRETLSQQRILAARDANALKHGTWVKVAGLVLIRQRPGTASGIVFITLEDETGVVNLIVRPNIYDKYRPAARHAALLQCDGYIERQGQVVHIMTKRMFDRSELIRGYEISSRDFH
jgi:error-prone DNA polymerase